MPRAGGDRGRLAAGDGRQQPVRRGDCHRLCVTEGVCRSSRCSTRRTNDAIAGGAVDPARGTLLVVASKSGGTVEVVVDGAFFWNAWPRALGRRSAGRHFIAITDPGTALQELAGSRRYREMFIDPADIGGRFSALSLFGLVPAALDRHAVRTACRRAPSDGGGCRQENHAERRARARRLHRCGGQRTGGTSLTVALLTAARGARPLDRAARRGEHRQARHRRAAGGRRSARATPDDYGADRAFVAVATNGLAGRTRLARARDGRPSAAALDDANR